MKQILIILFLFSALAATAQDTTRLDMIKDIKSIGRKITTQELSGRTVDNVRFGKITGKTDTLEVIVDRWKAINGGVFGNGNDMTSRINSMLGLSYVPEMIYGYDTLRQITVSGTVIHNKPAIIERGTSFTGSGTINFGGNFIDADPEQVIFATILTVTGVRTRTGLIPAKWFNTVGNGSTDNATALGKAQSAVYDKTQSVFISKGDYRINSAFTQTKSFVGEKDAIIKYNTASSATAVTMWTINEDSISFKNLILDGSNKVRRCIEVAANMTDVEIAYNTIKNFTQVGSDPSTVEGIRFTTGMDRLYIHHNTIINGDAPNTGAVNGIRGTYAGASPKDVRIMYNYFDNIKSTAGSDDADQIKIQDYTDSTGMIIAFNIHKNVWKRAQKLQASGIESFENQVWSTRYKTNNYWSFSAFSIYGSGINLHHNTVWEGVFETCIDLGANGSTGWNNNTIDHNRLFLSPTGLGSNDGIRLFGYGMKNNKITNNYVENVRKGIWIDANTYFTTVTGNEVRETAQTAISAVTSLLTYPLTWNYGLVMNNNRVVSSNTSNYAFELTKVNGLQFNNNSCDSTTYLLNYAQPYVDSLYGSMSGNVNFTTSGGSPNKGTNGTKPALTNANALTGIQYYNTTDNITYYWNGSWVAMGGANGDYTPTFANYTNTASVTNSRSGYVRNGNKVHVWIYATFTPTAGSTLTGFTATLPFASDLTNASDLTGHVSGEDGTSFFGAGTVKGSSGLDLAAINFTCASNVGSIVMITFDYTIQ